MKKHALSKSKKTAHDLSKILTYSQLPPADPDIHQSKRHSYDRMNNTHGNVITINLFPYADRVLPSLKINANYDLKRQEEFREIAMGKNTVRIYASDLPVEGDVNLYEGQLDNEAYVIETLKQNQSSIVTAEIPSICIDDMFTNITFSEYSNSTNSIPDVKSNKVTSELMTPVPIDLTIKYRSYSPHSSSSTSVIPAKTSTDKMNIDNIRVPRPVKLPLTTDFDIIFGKSGLVDAIKQGFAYKDTSLLIEFRRDIEKGPYKNIINTNLLEGIPEVTLTHYLFEYVLELPDDIRIYNRFMANIQNTLKLANDPVSKLSLGQVSSASQVVKEPIEANKKHKASSHSHVRYSSLFKSYESKETDAIPSTATLPSLSDLNKIFGETNLVTEIDGWSRSLGRAATIRFRKDISPEHERILNEKLVIGIPDKRFYKSGYQAELVIPDNMSDWKKFIENFAAALKMIDEPKVARRLSID